VLTKWDFLASSHQNCSFFLVRAEIVPDKIEMHWQLLSYLSKHCRFNRKGDSDPWDGRIFKTGKIARSSFEFV
jgi:hypothetical protein